MMKLILSIVISHSIYIHAKGDDGGFAVLVHGGSDAPPGMFPSVGYIVNSDGDNSCGATLIKEDWAVSAAHCFSDIDPEDSVPVRVVFGDIDTSIVTDSHQESCFHVIIHEDYNSDTLENDIALLRLKQPVKITDYVKPVNLSTSFDEQEVYSTCHIAGWGATEDNVYPNLLQYAEVTIQNTDVCDDIYDMESISISSQFIFETLPIFNEDLMLCVGSDKADACDGDSGGPLYCTDDISLIQPLVGIVSYGQANCTSGFGGVYTRVSAYTKWIELNSVGTYTTFSIGFCLFTTFCGKMFFWV